jgi:hypothetical protein
MRFDPEFGIISGDSQRIHFVSQNLKEEDARKRIS